MMFAMLLWSLKIFPAKALRKTKKALRFYAWAGRRYREEKFERKFPL